jgi:orotidine-5'-phosphate decarboxylase
MLWLTEGGSLLQRVRAEDRIIWSADVPDRKAVYDYLDQMPGLMQVKIDRLFSERNKPKKEEERNIILELREERGIRVFDDAKLIEVPSKLEELAKLHVEQKPWMLNCMAGSISNGKIVQVLDEDELDGLKRFADVCNSAQVRSCAVTVLTSKEEEIVQAEFSRSTIEQVLYYVEQLQRCGFTDIVCSALEAKAIRAEPHFRNLELNTPGIRPAGSEKGDQARTGTPMWAVQQGIERMVIGRPLTKGDPAENFRNIVAEIEAAQIA